MSHCITQLIFLGSITQWKRITYNGYMYPDWAQAVAWLLALSSFLAIPIFALYSIFHPKGSFREVWKIYCRIKWHCRISTWHLKKSRLQIKRSWLNLDWIIVYRLSLGALYLRALAWGWSGNLDDPRRMAAAQKSNKGERKILQCIS